MNRLFLVRHGGSTANEDSSFYNYNDSAICLTTNGIRQALNTAGVLAAIDPRWGKPGNFALEVFASEYNRTQQTARITLDQMGLLSVTPRINALLNERDYGTQYLPEMDTDPNCTANGSESSVQARARVRGFLDVVAFILPRADVLAFSHMGAIRALIAEILDLSDADMMMREVDNGHAFQFDRVQDPQGNWSYAEKPLPAHLLPMIAAKITAPPAAPPDARTLSLTRGGPSKK
ncbi:MAG TPA: histidine phosphatase family protein [Rhizomicrobium sp.]|jgi:broad specificity phosphatase PhoE